MTEQSIQTAAHKMVYILVVEQSLRAGEGMSEKALAPTCKSMASAKASASPRWTGPSPGAGCKKQATRCA
jgi:hypothetical protein